MSHAEHDTGSYDPTAARRSRRRKQATVGAVGLAALMGGAAFLVTEHLTADSGTVATETGALAPMATPSAGRSPSSSSPASPGTSARSAAAVSKSATSGLEPATTAERIAAARSAAAEAGNRVHRPLPTNPVAAAVDETTVTTTTTRTDGENLRVTWSRQNLAGFRELAWVADEGRRVGDARCSQTFRFSTNTQARERPTLLMCWRTSARKSVYTMAIKIDGHPSVTRSVAALDAQWAKLG